jgi:hypothetical protein
MADCYHFTREYCLWRLTFPQIHCYLDAHGAKMERANGDAPSGMPTQVKPPTAATLTPMNMSAFGMNVSRAK